MSTSGVFNVSRSSFWRRHIPNERSCSDGKYLHTVLSCNEARLLGRPTTQYDTCLKTNKMTQKFEVTGRDTSNLQ